MKLAKLESLRLAEFPNLVGLRAHTAEGPVWDRPKVWKRRDAPVRASVA